MHSLVPSDSVRLSIIDLWDAVADDNICMAVFHDCNEPVEKFMREMEERKQTKCNEKVVSASKCKFRF
jgi:hypothetical protein